MVGDIVRVFFSSTFAQALGAVRSFVLPVLLVPEQLGVWNLLNVIVGYGANSHVGLLHGMNKALPRITAKGNLIARNSLKDSVFWVNIALALSFSALVGCYIFLSLEYSLLRVAMVCVAIVSQSIYIYYLCLLRADCNFKSFSAASTLYSVVLTVIVVAFVFLSEDKVAGALVGLASTQLIVAGLMLRIGGYKFIFSVNWGVIRDALKLGFPIMVIGFIDMILLTMDRWIVLWKFSETELGIYAFATIFSVLVGSIPVAAGQVIYPFILKSETDAECRDSGSIALAAAPVVAFAVAVISVSLHFLVPLIVTGFFHNYLDAIKVAQVLLPAAFFLSLTHIAGTYLIAVNEQYKLPIVQIISVVAGIACSFGLVSLYPSPISVAYGTAIMYFVYGLGYLILAKRHACGSLIKALMFCIKVISPYFAALLVANSIPVFARFGELVGISIILLASCLILIALYLFNFRDNAIFQYATKTAMHRIRVGW